jgi:hypothetical protein
MSEGFRGAGRSAAQRLLAALSLQGLVDQSPKAP